VSTDTDLRARLRDLADAAPHAGLAGDDLWRTGVRRQRLRRAVTVAGTAVAVAVVVGLTSVLRFPTALPPTEGPAELGIPRVVLPPDPWSEPTATPGPLTAVSVALRSEPVGLTETRDPLQLFGISAVDGVARFLDVPGLQININSDTVAISPDGTRVAMFRWVGEEGAAIRGWDVLDTTTGELTTLRVADQPEIVAGVFGYQIAFTGDGRYLLTSFSLDGSDKDRAKSFVAWDVATGERYVAEGPGRRWAPGVASGPNGVVWTRGRDVLTIDPVTGDRSEISVPQQLVDASFSPDGETLAYIGDAGDRPSSRAPWQFHVREADGVIRTVDVGIEPGQILGWQDATHVVVSQNGPRQARVVDVVSGDWERLVLQQEAGALMFPSRYATDLFARDTVGPAEQPDSGDPRPWMHQEVQWIGIGLLLGGVLQIWLVIRRRRARA